MKIEPSLTASSAPATLSFSELKSLKEKEEQLEDIKAGAEIGQGVNYEADDLKEVERKLAQIKKIRQSGEAPDLSQNERLHLEQKEKMIREHMLKINPTFDDFQFLRPKDGPRYSRLVQQLEKNMQNKEYQAMTREWQDCRRKLYPDDAYAGDTRLLYKE